MKKQKYKKSQFTLEECETQINIIEKSDDKGYGMAFLNVKLPDGRWLVFTTDKAHRVPIYKKELEEKRENES